MYTDYHTHTPLCRHAEGKPGEFVQAAKEKGLTEYGIADHAPMPEEPFDDWRMSMREFPQYIDWIEAAREAAGDDLTIKAGLECDWIPGIEGWTEYLASLYSWDYLIGSVHYLGGKWDFDNPLWIPRWEKINVEEVWEEYWKIYANMARSGLFDIMGHVDLVKKFGYTPAGDLRRFYDPVIEAMLESGATLEINTAGWDKPCHEAYPSKTFLKCAREAGIPLVINSDAHAPAELAQHFERAREWAIEAGYTKLVRFNKRQKISYPL